MLGGNRATVVTVCRCTIMILQFLLEWLGGGVMEGV